MSIFYNLPFNVDLKRLIKRHSLNFQNIKSLSLLNGQTLNKGSFKFLHLLICCVYGKDHAFARLILDLVLL